MLSPLRSRGDVGEDDRGVVRQGALLNPSLGGNLGNPSGALRHLPYFAGEALLHHAINRPAAAFGNDPMNVLQWVFDVAGFAVDAVLCVDLQFFCPFCAVRNV